MDSRTAQRLAKRIEREDERCLVVDTWRYRRGSYGLRVVDNRTGYRFTVNTPEEWDEIRRETELYA